MSKFRADNETVYFGNEYICTISPPNRAINEERNDGESWLSMRERTRHLRDANQALANSLAIVVAKALDDAYKIEPENLNKQPAFDDSLPYFQDD